MCVCVWVYAQVDAGAHEVQKRLQVSFSRVTEGCVMPDMGAGNRTRVLGKSSWHSNPWAISQQRVKCHGSGSSSREPRGSSCGQCCTPHSACVSSLLWSVGALPKSAGCPGLSGSGQGHTALASAQSQKPRCSFSMSPLLPCWRAHPSLASIGRITGKDWFPAKRSMSTKCSLVFACTGHCGFTNIWTAAGAGGPGWFGKSSLSQPASFCFSSMPHFPPGSAQEGGCSNQ